MNIEIAGVKGRLYWQYHPTITYAFWLSDQTDEEIVGVAYRSAKDKHCKETARKVSLARLLQQTTCNRKQRKSVWLQYFDRFN